MRYLSIFILLLISSCHEYKQKENTEKVTTLPESAFWIENKERGNWFDIESVNSHRNHAVISIYDGKNKELILKKEFMKICPSDNLKFIEDLKSEIEYYDGKRIQLKDSCYLQ